MSSSYVGAVSTDVRSMPRPLPDRRSRAISLFDFILVTAAGQREVKKLNVGHLAYQAPTPGCDPAVHLLGSVLSSCGHQLRCRAQSRRQRNANVAEYPTLVSRKRNQKQTVRVTRGHTMKISNCMAPNLYDVPEVCTKHARLSSNVHHSVV